MNDISPDYVYSAKDARLMKRILPHEATPQAILEFSKVCNKLTDYAYWFVLGTLWVSYTGHSDLNLWKTLFSSDRPNKFTSLMKPSEYEAFTMLPLLGITAYRAHREGETDWIAYTLNANKAGLFAAQRMATTVAEYRICRSNVTALFLRRGESELIVLDRATPIKLRDIPVVFSSNTP